MESSSFFNSNCEEIQKLKNHPNNNINNQDNSSESIPINFSESSFFQKIFYLWVKPAMDLAHKRPLENKDVCKVSNDQRTIRTLPEYQEIFYKKAANKKSKYPLFFSILSLHY